MTDLKRRLVLWAADYPSTVSRMRAITRDLEVQEHRIKHLDGLLVASEESQTPCQAAAEYAVFKALLDVSAARQAVERSIPLLERLEMECQKIEAQE